MKKISLILPCYNEEKNIFPMFELCLKYLSRDYEYEFIFVNDGSKDNTFFAINNLIKKYNLYNIIGINFSRNFGKESAILAGLNNSSGDYHVIIDADMQQNPKYINQMAEILENENIDMVSAYQDKRKESKVLTWFKSLFYSLINKISDTKFEKNASDFRMFNNSVKESILSLDEYNRFSKGIFSWVGFNIRYIPYEVEDRINGKSKWSFISLSKYAIEGFVGYSTMPLRIATVLGFLTSISAGIYMLVVLFQKIFIGINIQGYATIVILILFFAGIQLISLGIIGEYLAKTYMEIKKRPHYIIKNIVKSKYK